MGHSVTATFAENGMGREGGDDSAQRGRSVIYDCLVIICSELSPKLEEQK